LNKSFEIGRLRASLENLLNNLSFKPSMLIVDGLDFENSERATFESFTEIAKDFHVAVWFSALSHRHIADVNERGIPYPCHQLDDFFSLIVQLQPEQSGICIRLLKDYDNPVTPDISVKLDPQTLLVLDSA